MKISEQDMSRDVRHLKSHPAHVTKINPYKAEELVCFILSDALECEVRHIGGRKDKGVVTPLSRCAAQSANPLKSSVLISKLANR
jgi:hypothetical protein